MKTNLSKNALYMATMLLVTVLSCKKAVNVSEEQTELASGKNDSEVSAALDIPARTVPTSVIQHLAISDDYRVEARVSGTTTYRDVPVYKTDNYAVNIQGSERRPQTSASFANFSFTNGTSIDVRIIAIKTAISTHKIRPSAYNIASAKPSNWEITYTINTNRKISVEINGTANPLFIFGNPPEPAANTTPGTGGTVYNYGPGVHNIGMRKAIKSGDRINIRAGAIVQGTFQIQNGSTDVKFLGHGILTTGNQGFVEPDTEQFFNSTFSGTSAFYNHVKNTIWQGLTIVNAPTWVFSCVYANNGNTHLSNNNMFKDLKQIHWLQETDPIWFDGDYNTVTDCFLFANDDITTHGSNNCTLSNLVIWQGGNGGHLFMADNWSSSNTITYDGVHLIGQDNVMETILVKGSQPNNTTVSNVTLKNIFIEKRSAPSGYWKNRLFSITNTGSGRVSVSNFTLQNVRVTGNQNTATADGEGILAPKGTATGLKFIDLFYGGTKMWSLSQTKITKNANVTGEVFQ